VPENPNTFFERVHDSLKINVFCAMSASKICRPFFFAEQTVTGIIYLDALEIWLMPQLLEDFEQTLIFQQYGTPPRYHCSVTDYIKETVPDRCNGRGRPTAWPPRSPKLTSMDFFLWRCVKDLAYVPPFPFDLNGLMIRIRESIQSIDLNTMNKT
jgi:hypothetical protein